MTFTQNIPKGFLILEPESTWGTNEDRGLHIVLVHPEIPGNTGNIGRLCAGANVALHLIRPLGFELENKHLRRAGLDYWPNVKLYVHDDWETFASYFPDDRLFFFTKKATAFFTDVSFVPGSVLIFGKETKGLPEHILSEYPDRLLKIPMTEKVRSLNLSNAAAVVTYEALRQLEWTPIHDT